MRFAWILVCAMALTVFTAPQEVGRETGRLVWIPLDSRPVNTAEVALFGEAAGLRVLMPPASMLDHYTERRAQFSKLVQWLKTNTDVGDTQVFYMNELLIGGLIASRDGSLYGDLDQRLPLVRNLLMALPRGRRIGVHILPRALPTQFRADGSWHPDYQWRDLLVRRSELRAAATVDAKSLAQVERAIPPGVRERYDALVDRNRQVVEAMLAWVRAGALAEVVIGLDDARPTGMANRLQQQVAAQAEAMGLGARVHQHYGADEIGFLLLAREAVQGKGVPLTFRIVPDRPDAMRAILPYEGVALGASITQKLTLLGARPSAQGDQAIYLLTQPWATSPDTAGRLLADLRQAHGAGQGITLADVTSTGPRDQRMVRELASQVPLGSVSYAAWNTASNTVGTGLAMAAVRELHRTHPPTMAQRQAWVAFQAVRYAHDLVYQAQREDLDRFVLAQGGDPHRLGPSRDASQQRLRALTEPAVNAWLGKAFTPHCVSAALSFPWDRTFEVAVQPRVRLDPGGSCTVH